MQPISAKHRGEERRDEAPTDPRHELAAVAAGGCVRIIRIPVHGDVDRSECRLAKYGVAIGWERT